MKKIKVLHVASFRGNIGDYANHQGFYKKFKKITPADFTQLEIRKFYKNRDEMRFDESFVELVNKYDLLILGGGGFFDLKWDYSNTGTTINLSKKIIESIKIPVLVNAMGYHEYGEVKDENVKKFKNFLEIITKRNNWLVTVRNDGSYERLYKRYGNLVKNITKVFDNGFYYLPKEFSKWKLKEENTTWIGMNVTNELFDTKFNNGITAEKLNELMSIFINKVLKENKNYKILFFTHNHQDITTLDIIMKSVDDNYKRESISVAPFFIEEKKIDTIFDLYRLCSCVIGMRFHTNVCSIAMNIPSIGLAGHEQISSLYTELGISERSIIINNEKFINNLDVLLKKTLLSKKNTSESYKKINNSIEKESYTYFNLIKSFLY